MTRVFFCLFSICLVSCNNSSNNLKVYESTGQLQCEELNLSLEESANKLIRVGLDVSSSECGRRTGIFTPSVCGGATTNIYIHTIPKQSISDAVSLGFSPVSELTSGYSNERCTE